MDKFYKDLGELIKQKRQKKRISHVVLARKLGLKRTSIINFESGRQRMLLHHALIIIKELNIDLKELYALLNTINLDEILKSITAEELKIWKTTLTLLGENENVQQ